jgi:hypothetical protein
MEAKTENKYKEKQRRNKTQQKKWKNEQNTVKCNTKRKQKEERHN